MPNVRIPLINRLTLAGRLAADPDMRHASGGAAYTKCRLAVDQGKGKDGKKKDAMFIGVTAFNLSAERLAECHKGAPIMIEGRLSVTESTSDAGEKRTYVDIIADSVHPLEWLDDAPRQTPAPQRPAPATAIPEDDIPF